MYTQGTSKALWAILGAILLVMILAKWQTCLFLLKMLFQLILDYLQPFLEKWGIHLPPSSH